MNILLFGDLVGRPGRSAVIQAIPELQKKYSPDIIIANVENSAHGFGITPKIIEELFDAGVHIFTSGNHVWKNAAGVSFLQTNPDRILVPENYTDGRPGNGVIRFEHEGVPICIMNLIGEVFMKENEYIASPFKTFDSLYAEHGTDAITIVDLHAEATGEKRAFSWYVNGRAQVVVGTHTHIPTADAQIMDEGTAYITDIGMCGAYPSSLGMDKELVQRKVALQETVSLAPPEDPEEVIARALFVEVDTKKRVATSVERIDHISSFSYTESR